MSSRQRERRRCLEVLGVQEDATDDDLRKAYRRMALIFHPDKNDSDDAKEKFQEISYAYKYLTEGPSAVGFEEDGHFSGHAGGHDVPIEVLIRLFPWMMADFGLSRPSHSPFGGLFGHPFSSPFHSSPFDHFFMDPFGGMGVFEDDSDDEADEVVVIRNGRITIVKTGNRRHSGRRRNRRGPRRRNYDPFESPFLSRGDPFSGNSRHSYHPTTENFHSHSRQRSGHQSSTPFCPRDDSNTPFTARKDSNSRPASYQSEQGSPTGNQSRTDGTSSPVNGAKEESKSKNKPHVVITSRKDRKKNKKANKTATQTKSSEQEEKMNQEEITDDISDDEISQYDNMEELSNTQAPLKLNKKQRRKLKRERERLEKEMGEKYNGSSRITPPGGMNVQHEVIEDDGPSTTSSATSDTEKEKQKTKFDPAEYMSAPQLVDHLEPRSQEDEEEMVRIAMEMSKLEMNEIDDDPIGIATASHDKNPTKGEKSKATPIHDEYKPSWFDDVISSPFEKSPMEDMKKTYYKDMGSSRFDPSSYYRANQPTGLRSGQRYNSSDKENYNTDSDKIYHRDSDSQPSGHSQRTGGHDPKTKGHSTKVFYSKNYDQPDVLDGASYQRPIDQHHQKYFKNTQKSGRGKHSFDMDEPDDVPLNTNDNNSRGAQNGNFQMGDMLNSSLNVPKGIRVNNAKYMYGKK